VQRKVRADEVLREGSGIRVDGTAGDGLATRTYIKDAGNLPGKRPPGLDFFIINVGILGLFVLIIDGVSTGQHALMQDTRN
jgi:hypothetical protein